MSGIEPYIPVNEPVFEGNERRYVLECLDTGWVSSEGPFVERFEQAFAERVERRHGIAVCNGSVALEVAVAALRLGAGDEVILPSFTIISCAAAIIRAGAKPVFVDSDPATWNMDPTHIESRINNRTRAIMVVHIYGLPADMDRILEIAERHGLAIIEDAAEVCGQTYRDRPCGTFGDISTFSFYPNKHVTTGEGGMVVTNDADLAERCRSLRNLCFSARQRFVHEELGWNFRMTNLQAALGLAQLERLNRTVARKRAIGAQYAQLLHDVENLQIPLKHTPYAENIYWVFGVVLGKQIPFGSQQAMQQLADARIGTRPFFWPMHEQPVLRDMGLCPDEPLPVAENLARRGFYVPSGLALTDDQIERSAISLREICT